MKVVFMGTPDFSVGTLEALVEAGYEITGVVTQPDKPKGRGKQMMPTPVKEAAEKHGLPVYQPRRVRDAEAIEEIRKMEPDVIVVVAFGQIIPKEILDMPKYGCINVHASLLPAYRGAAPIQWAVMNGDEVSGVTIMKMDEGLDTGDMLTKVEVPLAADETGGSLFDKLAAAGAKLLVETLPKLEKGEVTPEKQPEIIRILFNRFRAAVCAPAVDILIIDLPDRHHLKIPLANLRSLYYHNHKECRHFHPADGSGAFQKIRRLRQVHPH